MKILFVCRGNVGRSIMAEAIFNMLTDHSHDVSSAGTIVKSADGEERDGQLLKDCKEAEKVIAALQDYAIYVSQNARKQLYQKMLEGVDRIVVMAEKETIPDYLAGDPRIIYWEVKDPKGTDLETHKNALSQIKALVEDFIKTFKKDFDLWNKRKKEINELEPNFYRERDIRWCSLGINIGFEQDGTSLSYRRPVLIIKASSRHVCLVIPHTTSQKKNRYHLDIGVVEDKKAYVILSQLRLIDTKRLHDRLAIVDKEKFEEIKKAIRALI